MNLPAPHVQNAYRYGKVPNMLNLLRHWTRPRCAYCKALLNKETAFRAGPVLTCNEDHAANYQCGMVK